MSEDNRIPEIRAVLTEFTQQAWALPGPLRDALERIDAILDSAPPRREPWQVQAHIREQTATALGYCEQVVEEAPDGDDDTCGELRLPGSAYCAEHQPAPRVFFPGDTVPGRRWVSYCTPTGIAAAVSNEDWMTLDGAAVELTLPSADEWVAAVDRAHRARLAEATAQPHLDRASEERAIPEPTEGQNP